MFLLTNKGRGNLFLKHTFWSLVVIFKWWLKSEEAEVNLCLTYILYLAFRRTEIGIEIIIFVLTTKIIFPLTMVYLFVFKVFYRVIIIFALKGY